MSFKSLVFTLIACSLLPVLSAQNNLEPINSVLGDTSFYWKFGRFPGPEDSEFKRVTTHLAYTESRLRKATSDDLSPELAHKRFEMLDHLRDYYLHGSFPANFDRVDRRPCFIDAEERICAVGYLLEQTEGREMAEQINHTFQYALIEEMDTDFLGAWAKEYGLSVQDLAMIQPAYAPTVKYPHLVGNTGTDLQKWVDSRFTYPNKLTETATLQIYFVVSELGIPSWPISIEGAEKTPKEFIKALRQEILKMKFTPYFYNGTKREFRYSMTLALLPIGKNWDDGKSLIIPHDSLQLNPPEPGKTEITLTGWVEQSKLSYKWGSKTGYHHEPIIGATVTIPGTSSGAISDKNGYFKLTFLWIALKIHFRYVSLRCITNRLRYGTFPETIKI